MDIVRAVTQKEIMSSTLTVMWKRRPAMLVVGLLLLAPSIAKLNAQDDHKYTNALIDSTSPYLLQHAHNPVNWMPWGPEAFEKARKENKPIFVSIGYSTCYWCHVMERESFENEEVAKVINEHYIAIKVDREERPDIDEQLMLATQLMTGRGGWPNSIWLTTDGRPWMAGTYFPKDQFVGALTQLSSVWKSEPAAVQKQADSLSNAIRQASQVPAASPNSAPSQRPMEQFLLEAAQIFDGTHGGFGTRPKFPPHGMLRLLAEAAREEQDKTGPKSASKMLNRTLEAMWYGGIHDHVGGGIHRYSTDERWFLPHFEKMLYDNAQLVRALAEAAALELSEEPGLSEETGPNAEIASYTDQHRRAIADIFGWLKREMTHEQGAFYSALDSESEGGEEGRYYTWSMKELEQELGQADAKVFAQYYNFEPPGNFTEEATGHRPGTNIPYLKLNQKGQSEPAAIAKLRAKLLAAREDREYPHLDDKVLTSWNGLMISALARAGSVLDEPQYVQAAERAALFVQTELVLEGQLQRSWRDGRASLPAYLNDYAFFAEGLLELYAATEQQSWLDAADAVALEMIEKFEDKQGGGFFFTSADHEELLLRSKNLMGGGNLPVGNGVAVQVLLRLYEETGKPEYLAVAERTLRSFSGLMQRSPRQVEHLVIANLHFLRLSQEQSETEEIADAYYLTPVVAARVYSSHLNVTPGSRLELAVVLDVERGYHLYADTNDPELVKPTSIAVAEDAGWQVGEIEQPAGTIRFDGILDAKIAVLEGQLKYFIPIEISEQAELGEVVLPVTLKWQACDGNRCLAPEEAQVSIRVTVQDTAGTPRHADVFRR